jgi:hypothetical protein
MPPSTRINSPFSADSLSATKIISPPSAVPLLPGCGEGSILFSGGRFAAHVVSFSRSAARASASTVCQSPSSP